MLVTLGALEVGDAVCWYVVVSAISYIVSMVDVVAIDCVVIASGFIVFVVVFFCVFGNGESVFLKMEPVSVANSLVVDWGDVLVVTGLVIVVPSDIDNVVNWLAVDWDEVTVVTGLVIVVPSDIDNVVNWLDVDWDEVTVVTGLVIVDSGNVVESVTYPHSTVTTLLSLQLAIPPAFNIYEHP